MWLQTLWQSWLGQGTTGPRPRRQEQRRRGPRLAVEQLEDRTVPSSFTAASVSDLIADINAANKHGGSNTITLSAPATSPYLLTGAYGNKNSDGATGLPTIALNDNLTIVGNGDTIERSTTSGTPAFRLFDVASGGSLTLQNLTLQGGWAFGSGVSAEGGAIYNQGALVLNGVTVQNNIAQGSDGAPTIKGPPHGTSAAGDGADAAGGAIYSGSGTLTLDGATVQGNQALGGNGGTPTNTLYNGGNGGDGSGGGLYAVGGTVNLTNTTLSNNRAAGGNGGFGYISGSGGSGSGGGLYAGGTLTLNTVIVDYNLASGAGAQGGGICYLGSGAVSLLNDTVEFNNADGSYGGTGGGIYVNSGSLTLNTVIVDDNLVQGLSGVTAGGIYAPGVAEGGGIFVASSTASLVNVTVEFNNAQSYDLAKGGGLYIAGGTVGLDAFTVAHVINNTASTAYPDLYGSYTLLP